MLAKCLWGEGVLMKILLIMLTWGGASKNVGGGGVVNEKIPDYVEKWRSLQNIYLLFFKSVVCLIFSSKKNMFNIFVYVTCDYILHNRIGRRG